MDTASFATPDAEIVALRRQLVARDVLLAERDAALTERDALLLTLKLEIEKLKVLLARARREQSPCAGLYVAVLLAVLGNAVITGGLSCPHDRYQSRVIWLPAAIVLLAVPGGRLRTELHGTAVLARAVIFRAASIRPRGYA